MKKLKKLVMSLTAAFALCLLFANVVNVQAYETRQHMENKVYINKTVNASGNYVDEKKIRIGLFNEKTIRIDFTAGQEVTNLKANKKTLETVVTSYYANSSTYYVWDKTNKKYTDDTFKMGYAEISLYATKAGSYKVTFNVGSAKYTVNVLASNSGVFTKAVLGKTNLSVNKVTVKNGELTQKESYMSKVTAKKGKLKITAGSQYKITGIVVEYVDKNGKEQIKKYKNGKTINLSQAYYTVNKGADGYLYRTSKKLTYIYISYKDKFTGTTVTYSVVKNRGKKEIKKVRKDGITNKVYTAYDSGYYYDASYVENYESVSPSLTLWSY